MDVAEELLDLDHTVDRAYVERRLDDWFGRVDRLYADIESWLPDAHYLIIDRVDSFEPSDWRVATLMKRREQRPFDRDFLSAVLL